MNPDRKHCRGCDTDRSVKSFNAHRKAKDGLQSHCAFCKSVSNTTERARRLGLTLELTPEEIRALIVQPCVYCTYWSEHRPNGLDRVDSSGPYTPANIVVACRWCNQAKSSLTVDQFKDHVTRLNQTMVSGTWPGAYTWSKD